LAKENKNLKEQTYQVRMEMQTDRQKLEASIADTSHLHDELLAKDVEVSKKLNFKILFYFPVVERLEEESEEFKGQFI